MHTIDLTNAWEPPVAGPRTWVRRFGRPSGIEPGDRVWLVMDMPPAADAALNGARLPPPTATTPWRAEVTGLLAPRNELILPVDVDGGGMRRAALPTMVGRVWLEIETPG